MPLLRSGSNPKQAELQSQRKTLKERIKKTRNDIYSIIDEILDLREDCEGYRRNGLKKELDIHLGYLYEAQQKEATLQRQRQDAERELKDVEAQLATL